MFKEETARNYSKQINGVLNYILKHLKDDLSLQKLAGIANYSPFHFQKIFKNVTGTTPKQFVIKTKLESAGFMIIHQNKPVAEIAAECGFSSPSVFARSFKNYFGLSAEEMRSAPVKERGKFIKNESFVKELCGHEASAAFKASDDLTTVAVKKLNTIRGVFTNTSLHESRIVKSFRKSLQLAETADADISGCCYMGIIYPHQDIYRALVTLHSAPVKSKKENYLELKPGRYATFKVTGPLEKTFHGLHSFHKNWLPHSGYQLADIWIFEMLSQNPAGKPYHEMEREVYIPIEPD